MIENLEINIDNINLEEKKSREKCLKLFHNQGFPTKKLEEWKFTDLNRIITDNFKNLNVLVPLPKLKVYRI